METQIGKICVNLHHRIYNIKKLTPFTYFSTRLQLIKSMVIGKLIYALPLYMQATTGQINKIHRVIMASARTIIGNYCYKKSIKYILGKCNMLDAKNMIAYSSIILLNKILTYKIPPSIYMLYRPSNRGNTDTTTRTKLKPKTKKLSNHVIYKGAVILNAIPNDFKKITFEKFE